MHGVVVVMGVAGSGKSTLGERLGRHFAVPFADGDAFHSVDSLEKMSRGEALTDRDRQPWLDAIGRWAAAEPNGCVVACSALRRSYRDRLRQYAPACVFVQLSGSRELLHQRLVTRCGHFMPASLLDSQIRTLEPLEPTETGFTIDASLPPDRQLRVATQLLASVWARPSDHFNRTSTGGEGV